MERSYRRGYDRGDYGRRQDYRTDDDRYGRRSGRGSYDRDDRDFFDRASDEVRSWFGDEDAERRRERDERYDRGGDYGRRDYDRRSYGDRDYDRRDYDRRGFGARDYGRERHSYEDRHRDYDRDYYDRTYGRRREGYGHPEVDRRFGREDYDDRGHGRGADDWRRTDQDYLASYDRDRSQRVWERDPRGGYDDRGAGRRSERGRGDYGARRGGNAGSDYGTRDFGQSYSEAWEGRARRRDY